MANPDIEENGLNAVIAHENAAGRTSISRVRACGFDLVSKKEDGSDERHIEVKATTKNRFTFRWLEELEQRALESDDRFFLYLVTGAGTDTPRVLVYDRDKLNERFSEAISHHVYVFPKADFFP